MQNKSKKNSKKKHSNLAIKCARQDRHWSLSLRHRVCSLWKNVVYFQSMISLGIVVWDWNVLSINMKTAKILFFIYLMNTSIERHLSEIHKSKFWKWTTFNPVSVCEIVKSRVVTVTWFDNFWIHWQGWMLSISEISTWVSSIEKNPRFYVVNSVLERYMYDE